ncbi:trimeric intracellular cation channel family protein [Nostocoides sp. HKS02]|uniref:trimeric intracellular cation channel family protein n=1 Tax=Nostocoides sp. HKS02 TaxID=1813880 RepID=UPI0012B4D848|nr:trimeric intracellular cation channel family protein [Tetrasphaera sp. HKS02]QGN57525.1 trimeric intracellular cation channel family protein [Tetrasphaera sp. HKS02]
MITYDANLQLALDLVGVFAFALSGGLVAVKKRLDLFGVLVLSGAAALGGGVMRDLLIGHFPPVGISDWRLVCSALVAGLVTFVYHPAVARISRVVRVLDAAGLAVFAIGGSLKALGAGMGPLASVIIGGVTAVGGGIVRDVLAGQVPEVLRREMYALPALLGATLIVLAHRFDHDTPPVLWGCVALVFALRMVAVVLDVHAPKPLRTGEVS